MAKKKLTQNAVYNGIKQICSIIFPMITFPYATRILGAASYGKFGFSNSIVSYFVLIAALGINDYGTREGAKRINNKTDLNNTVNEIFTINLISTLVAYLLLLPAILLIDKFKGYESIICISALSIAFTTIGRDWVNAIYEDYRFIAIRYIVCQGIAIVLMLVFVKTPDDILIYALTAVSGTILANILNVLHIRRKYGIGLHCVNLRRTIRHLKPIMLLFGTGIAFQIYINSDITLIGFFLDDTEVGFYSVSVRIYMLVKSLCNAALLVGIPRFTKRISEGDHTLLCRQYSTVFSALLVILFPMVTGLCSLSRSIITLFAGPDYIQSVTSLQILSVALFFASAACFFVCDIMLTHNMEKSIFWISVASAFVNVIGNVILIPIWGINAAALTTLLSEMIMLIAGIIKSKQFFRFSDFSIFATCLLGVAEVFLSCFVASCLTESNLLHIVLSLLFSIVLYIPTVFLTQKKLIHVIFH